MESQWNGKLWYAYGTSMTSGEWGKFVPVVAELGGLRVHNRGIPGGCLTPDGRGHGNVLRAVLEEDGKENADLITLEVLPNEGANVGEICDTDEASFCGCLNRALRHLQETTRAQIVLIVMILGNDAPPEKTGALRGMTNFEFAERAERVGHLNGVPVINVFAEAGFGYARVRSGAYQRDYIHLNDLGGRNMGRFIWSRLKDIPLWESE